MDKITKRLVIQGMVQGVGFRYSMCDKAQQVGVTGWVCNRRDGGVEAMVQGDDLQVQAMIEWARRGPSVARVQNVDVFDGEGNFDDFSIEFRR